jgi:hypothetical protein
MSLNFNFEAIADYKNTCWVKATMDATGQIGSFDIKGKKPEQVHEFVHPILDTIIWMTMVVGINRITKENAEEFVMRVRMIEALDGRKLVGFGPKYAGPDADLLTPGTFRKDGTGNYDRKLTTEVVAKFAGLTTNASSMTLAQFAKKLGEKMKAQVSK